MQHFVSTKSDLLVKKKKKKKKIMKKLFSPKFEISVFFFISAMIWISNEVQPYVCMDKGWSGISLQVQMDKIWFCNRLVNKSWEGVANKNIYIFFNIHQYTRQVVGQQNKLSK